jgi:ABC-2 type transport system ATP-binding protein
MLRELARLGKAILISSHALSDLAEICTHLGVMQDGELLMEAALDEMMSAVFPESYLRVQLLDPGDTDAASRIVGEHSSCRQVEAVDASTLLVSFEGAQGDLAAVLGQLLRNGIRVTQFTLERPTLEDLFTRVTAEEADA